MQGELELALTKIADQPVQTSAAGRTDAGVHATGQVVAFATPVKRSLATWLRGLNGLTPGAMRIDWVHAVPTSFHPRFSATARSYIYVFHDVGDAYADPLLRSRVWSCKNLDADRMHNAAQALLGEQDFSGFRAAGCQSVTPVRRLDRCNIMRFGDFVILDIQANAFLLHMVRNIARVLHDVGRGAALALPQKILRGRDRTVLGATAPAGGLYLRSVTYPQFEFPEGKYPALVNGAFKH